MRRRRRQFIRRAISMGMLCMTLAGCEKQDDGEVFEAVEAVESADGDARTERDADCGSEEKKAGEEDPETVPCLYVYVCGQVAEPGVYQLQEGRRVTDALEMAGGATDAAALQYLNLAALLADGQKIYVPSLEEVEAAGDPSLSAAQDGALPGVSGKVNLNTADKEALMSLSGIGESRAEEILAYRREHGAFRSVEEIKNVSGIGEGIFRRIKEQITV